jgi:hypothetical protein
MDFSNNVTFIDKINTCVTDMMKDGKIDKNDIPRLMILVTELMTSSTKSVTTEQMVESINSLYNYIMSHYKLFPEDDTQKAEFKTMFDMCVKLALFQPNINKKCNSLFNCMS